MKLEIFFDSKPWTGSVDCWIIQTRPDGSRRVCLPMEMEFASFDGLDRIQPSLVFGPTARAEGFFEALVEALARAGYKQENNESGELKATKLHLQDLQKMVFTQGAAS